MSMGNVMRKRWGAFPGVFWLGLVLVATTLCAAHAWSQDAPLAAPPGAKVIDLNSHPGFFNEPSIAFNPLNPQQMVVAYQSGASIAYSQDGGAHWRAASGTKPRDYRVSGDVSVAFDNSGHAFLCYIAFDKLGTDEYWGNKATRNGVFIRRSFDAGKTWERDHIPVIEHATRPGIPFEDKPYIVADNTDGLHAGNLYVGWTQFTVAQSTIVLSRSTDDGKTWSTPMRISTHAGLPRDDNGSVEGFTGVVGPDGVLYVVWADGDNIAFTSSHDGGKSFAPSHNIIATAPPYFHIEDVERTDGFPVIAIDPRGGNGAGLLYVAWSDYRNGDVDVFCSTSADRGKTWTPAVRVNSDPIHNGSDQFFQWLAVDATNGAANMIFYDRRGDPDNEKAMIVLARSTDHGSTFTNYAWTQNVFDPGNDFLGDYTAIATVGGRVYGAWAEERPAFRKREPDIATHHTILRVGLADFGGGANPAAR